MFQAATRSMTKQMLSARQIALAALRLWRRQKPFADSLITTLLGETKLASSDRAFALELFYGVLRNLTLLDFWIGSLRSLRVRSDVRDVLRLGLYQLFFLETAPHAAVYETVELALKRERPLVNGILRGATRRCTELLELANAQPLAVRTSHPQFLIDRWNKCFGYENTEKLCRWNNSPAPVYARVNQLKISRAEFLRIYSKSHLLTDCSSFVEFDALPATALARGHCYVQDPSTAIACNILSPEPGEKVLDACAAPGGKTSYIAQLMENRGVIVACDRDPERLETLNQNLARLGVNIARVVSHDWTCDRVPPEVKSLAPFDRILLDAPCSNTGVMRRRVDVRWRLTPSDFSRMQERQIAMARTALGLLKPGGTFVYSTCSLEPEENEGVVRRIIAEMPIMRLEAESASLPFRDRFDGAYAAKFVRVR